MFFETGKKKTSSLVAGLVVIDKSTGAAVLSLVLHTRLKMSTLVMREVVTHFGTQLTDSYLSLVDSLNKRL